MVGSQVLVSASFDNWHGLFEGFDQVLELLDDLVGGKSSDKSVCDLLIVVGILLDFLIIDVFPDLLFVRLLKFLPFGKRVPEGVTCLKLLLEFINV